MSPESHQLVRESWTVIEPRAGSFAAMFYEQLFVADPAVQHMFAARDMTTQQEKFTAMLGQIVDALDDPARLISVLVPSGRRHAAWGVTDAHYETVGAALIAALHVMLGASFTPQVRHAWIEAYTLVAAVMQRGAQAAATHA